MAVSSMWNHPVIFIGSGLIILYMICQSILFMKIGYKEAISMGINKSTLLKIMKSSIGISVLPTLPIGNVSLIMFVACIGELMAYPPILGPGSLYMSNVSGNTSNLKIPCAITAIKTAKIETGTPAANAVSMIAVGVSSITTTLLIILSL